MTRILPFTPSLPFLSDVKQRLITAFPRTSAQQDLQRNAEVVSYSWPLPGASAAKSKASPPKRIKLTVSSAQKKIAQSRIYRHKTRSRSGRIKDERKFEPNNAARNVIAAPGVAQGNSNAGDGTAKESMTSYGTYGSYVGTKNKLAAIDREQFEKKSHSNEGVESSHSALMNGKVFFGSQSNGTTERATMAPEIKAERFATQNKVNSESSRDESLRCLYVTDVQECYEYMRLMRYSKENNYYCLHSSLSSMFDHLFHDAVHKKNMTPREVVFSHVNRHQSPRGMRLSNFNEISGMISERKINAQEIIRKNPDSLFSVLTLSVISNESIKQKNISSRFVIPENMFKLFKSPAPVGTGGYFIAYHINKCRENNGFNAGIIPLAISDDFIMLDDQATGLMMSGDNINNFINGISKVTGLKYHYNENANRRHTDLELTENYIINTQSLFINQNTTRRSGCSLDNINEELAFFSPAGEVIQDDDTHLPLYRNCFTLLDESLIYVNEHGEKGVFKISPVGRNSLYYAVSPESLGDSRHYSQAGFLYGENYTRKMLIDQLLEKGMNYLSIDTDLDLSAKNDGFYMDIEWPDDGLSNLDVTTEAETTTTDRGLPSSDDSKLSHFFSFHNNMLRYYDEDGEYGELFFTPQHRGLLRLDYNLTAAQRIFLRKINIVPGLYYNTNEITNRLENATFVNDPDMQQPDD